MRQNIQLARMAANAIRTKLNENLKEPDKDYALTKENNFLNLKQFVILTTQRKTKKHYAKHI